MTHKVIRPSQTTFLSGRYILEGVVTLHQTIHELHWKKKSRVILKLDFEKAYDKVKWPLLQQVLRMKGISSLFSSWTDKITSLGSVAIKVNDDIGHFLQTKKGVRQGDPLSRYVGCYNCNRKR